MKVEYTKNNNHFMFYSSDNKFLASTLLTPLKKNSETATVPRCNSLPFNQGFCQFGLFPF